MKHIPNVLSFIRLALCPVFITTFFAKTPSEAFWIFALASCLDVIDGFIARRFNAITLLGKILDPVADKVLQLSAIVCFTVKDLIPFFAIIVIGLKELTMLIGGGIISKKQKTMVYSNTFGKIASFMMYFSLCAMFFIDGFLSPIRVAVYVLFYIALLSSVIAMVQYGISALFIKKTAPESVESAN